MKLLLISLFMIICLCGCESSKPNTNTRNPLIDDGNFTNYIPWWVTNDTQMISSNNVFSIEE